MEERLYKVKGSDMIYFLRIFEGRKLLINAKEFTIFEIKTDKEIKYFNNNFERVEG